MCAKWNNKYNQDILVARLESLKRLDDFGNFTGFFSLEFDDYLIVLESSLDFNNQIPESERTRILYKTVFSIAKDKHLTAKDILGAVSKEENLYLKKPKQKYILATNLSVVFFKKLKRTSINNIPIIFSKTLPKRFNQQPIKQLQKKLDIEDNSSDYTCVRVFVNAREEREAFKIAIDALDLLRGIWNFYLNNTLVYSFSRGSRIEVVNKVRLGSFHTLHTLNGNLAPANIIWHEPDYINNVKDIQRDWDELQKFEQATRKHLSKHLYRKEIEDVIKRYVRALDYRDLHVSFLELWGVLEKLTFTVKAEYDKTIARTLFHFDDIDLHKQVLQHLRIYRNANVHTGQRTEQKIEILLYQLKRYVDKLLFFHIINRFKFTNIEEAARLFDSPTTTVALQEKIVLLKNAMKYRS